jgi:hypothetical protein
MPRKRIFVVVPVRLPRRARRGGQQGGCCVYFDSCIGATAMPVRSLQAIVHGEGNKLVERVAAVVGEVLVQGERLPEIKRAAVLLCSVCFEEEQNGLPPHPGGWRRLSCGPHTARRHPSSHGKLDFCVRCEPAPTNQPLSSSENPAHTKLRRSRRTSTAREGPASMSVRPHEGPRSGGQRGSSHAKLPRL